MGKKKHKADKHKDKGTKAKAKKRDLAKEASLGAQHASDVRAEPSEPRHLPKSYTRELADFAWSVEEARGASVERLASGLFVAVPWVGTALCLVGAVLVGDAPEQAGAYVKLGAVVVTALLVASFVCAVAGRLGGRRQVGFTPREAVGRAQAAGSGEEGYLAVVEDSFERSRASHDGTAHALVAASVLAFVALGVALAGLVALVVVSVL